MSDLTPQAAKELLRKIFKQAAHGSISPIDRQKIVNFEAGLTTEQVYDFYADAGLVVESEDFDDDKEAVIGIARTWGGVANAVVMIENVQTQLREARKDSYQLANALRIAPVNC